MPAKMTTTTIRETPIWTMRRRRFLGRAFGCGASVTGRSLPRVLRIITLHGIRLGRPQPEEEYSEWVRLRRGRPSDRRVRPHGLRCRKGSPMLEVSDATVSLLKALLP